MSVARKFKQDTFLSTTHFGLAAPFLAKSREDSAHEILNNMTELSSKAADIAVKPLRENLKQIGMVKKNAGEQGYVSSIHIFGSENNQGAQTHYLNVPSSIVDAVYSKKYYLKSFDGKKIDLIPVTFSGKHRIKAPDTKFILSSDQPLQAGVYHLFKRHRIEEKRKDWGRNTHASGKVLMNEYIQVQIGDNKNIEKVFFRKTPYLNKGSLIPKITFKEGERYFTSRPDNISLEVLKNGDDGVASILLQGSWSVKNGTQAGSFSYVLTLVSGTPYLFVDGTIHYPETAETDKLYAYDAALARAYDKKWFEVAPLELKFAFGATPQEPFTIHKKNYLGKESSYKIDYFKYDDRNFNLANVNNHITSDYVALSNKNQGTAIAMDMEKISSFACCPVKVAYHPVKNTFEASMNPFGAYFGKQYFQPTWSDGVGWETAVRVGPQYKSSAPGYNGFTHSFTLMIAFFDEKLTKELKYDLVSFARPPLLVAAEGSFSAETSKKLAAIRWSGNGGVSGKIIEEYGAKKNPTIPLALKIKLIFRGAMEKLHFGFGGVTLCL